MSFDEEYAELQDMMKQLSGLSKPAQAAAEEPLSEFVRGLTEPSQPVGCTEAVGCVALMMALVAVILISILMIALGVRIF